MTSKSDTDMPVDAQTRRLLRQLSARGAWLAASCGASGEVPPAAADAAWRLMARNGSAAPTPIPGDLVQAVSAKGWVALQTAPSGEARLTLTAAGVESLRRALSGIEGPGRVENRAGKAAIPAPRPRPGRREPTETRPGFDEAESPLGWLRRRHDKHGAALLTDEQFAAGERLRADVFFAGLSPRITASWSQQPGAASGRRSAPGGSAQMLDTMVAARQRIDRAMRVVGPELSGILLDVCGFMKGLESIETERGWPSRSAKVVLLLALSRLATHYGIRPASDRSGARSPSRVRHWGAADFRPGLEDWENSQDEEITQGDRGRRPSAAQKTRH